MNKRRSTTKIIIGALLFLSIAVGSGGIWLLQSWKATKQAAVDAAYTDFLAEALPDITNRYHERHVVFTDSVERFRFDGADETLVEELVKRHGLKPTQEPLQSDFKAPSWWVLPEEGACYLRGDGHSYSMLVYQPDTSRVFFERTQD